MPVNFVSSPARTSEVFSLCDGSNFRRCLPARPSPWGMALARGLLYPVRMSLDECLRSELAALTVLVEEAAPHIADRRPWWLRFMTLLAGVTL